MVICFVIIIWRPEEYNLAVGGPQLLLLDLLFFLL